MQIGTKLRKIYEEEPSAKEDFIRGAYTPGLNAILERLENYPLANFSLEALDKYESDLDLCFLLAHLSHETVCREFGFEPLFWTWTKYPYAPLKDKLRGVVSEVMGEKPEVLEKARIVTWELSSMFGLEFDASTTLSNVSLIHKINNGLIRLYDLPSLLRESAKEGVILSDKRIRDYSLQSLNTKKDSSQGYEQIWGNFIDTKKKRKFRVYLDTPAGIALMYRGNPNALMGVVATNPNTLMISQLQGVQAIVLNENEKLGDNQNASSRGLMPIDWQKLMVKCGEDLAREMGFKDIGIISGYNNIWTKKCEIADASLSLDRAIQLYDNVAERLNFKQRKDKNWYKEI